MYNGVPVLDVHGQRMLDGNYKPGFRARLYAKDLRIASRTLAEHETPAPVSAAVHQLVVRIARDGEKLVGPGWDEAAQTYLALAALDQAQRDLARGAPVPRMKGTLETLSQLLAFPSAPSARGNGPDEQSYPTRQEKYRQTLEELAK